MIAGDALRAGLDDQGFGLIPGLLDRAACNALAAGYDFGPVSEHNRHGPPRLRARRIQILSLPAAALDRRASASAVRAARARRQRLAGGAGAHPLAIPIATRISSPSAMRPARSVPTPLILRYGSGDYNCLHQDVYGATVFPLQVAVLLSSPANFSGGEFVRTEQRPRRQSRAQVVPLEQGDAVVFAVRERPVRGTHGYYRVQHRHGVSEVRSGQRHTLGVIFHDAA